MVFYFLCADQSQYTLKTIDHGYYSLDSPHRSPHRFDAWA